MTNSPLRADCDPDLSFPLIRIPVPHSAFLQLGHHRLSNIIYKTLFSCHAYFYYDIDPPLLLTMSTRTPLKSILFIRKLLKNGLIASLG